MRKYILGLLLVAYLGSYGQMPGLFANKKVTMTYKNGTPVSMPFTGGFTAPQFQLFDLDMDGTKDLVIFDRDGNKAITYLYKNGIYEYAPKYESIFNFIDNWFIIQDYNRDGLDDVFCGNNSNIDVYKNISAGGKLEFVRVVETLTDTLNIGTYDDPLRGNIYTTIVNYPAIQDFDGDGDIDILVMDILGGQYRYYKNVQVEGHFPKDSIAPEFVDGCWGSFYISFTSNFADIGQSCYYQKNYRHQAHYGSAICVFDQDGDGDLDMLHGDVNFSYVSSFKNGKKDYNWSYDTIIQADSQYLKQTKRADVYNFPACFYIDVDHDGKRDLLISSNNARDSKGLDHMLYYHNKGTDATPSFEYIQSDFMIEKTIDIGKSTAPTFYDYNNDGLEDLVVATGGDFTQTLDSSYMLYLYKNVGTTGNPKFQPEDSNWLNMAAQKLMFATPAFGDLDKDGKKDLIVGSLNGQLAFWKGNGTGFQFTTDFFDGIDIGSFSAPAIADIDGDGDNDLVIGKRNGTFSYYEYTGGSPAFTLITDTLGGVNVADSFFDYGDLAWYRRSEGMGRPCIMDMDKDGNPDLLTGATNGGIRLFLDVRHHTFDFAEEKDSFIYDYTTDTFDAVTYGAYTSPASALLDNDTFPDLFSGISRGGLYYLGSVRKEVADTEHISVIPVTTNSTSVSVFPNPANDLITIIRSGPAPKTAFVLYDLMGREVGRYAFDMGRHQMAIPVADLVPGVYIIRWDNGKQPETLRFVKE